MAGGSADLYGVSSGGALVLEAAAAGLTADRLAIYEVPYFISDELVAAWRTYVQQLETALAEDRRGDALELFMRLAGASEEDVAGAEGLALLVRHGDDRADAHLRRCLYRGRPPDR